jgi:hypothetical protein
MNPRPRDEHEAPDKQLDQLLQEVRVAIPGVQMLFGFLLIVPFSERFPQLRVAARLVYFVVFAATTLACIALIAPSAFHRIHKGHDVRLLLSVGNKLTLTGLGFLGVALVGSTHLITTFVFGDVFAYIATLIVAVAVAGVWLILPIASRTRPREPQP